MVTMSFFLGHSLHVWLPLSITDRRRLWASADQFWGSCLTQNLNMQIASTSCFFYSQDLSACLYLIENIITELNVDP